jgi:peptidyl-prolyl cis-trans isomerase D
MAKNPKKRIEPTKKHLARMERENLQKRYILIASLVVVVLVVGLVIYGLLDQYYLQSLKPVAVVNGEKIQIKDFQGQTRFARYNMIQNAYNIYQLSQFLGSDSATLQPIVNQLQTINDQLFPTDIGRQVLDQMVDSLLIEQEAQKLNIDVSKDEIDREIEQAFGYYRNGRPTLTPTIEPVPTSTLSDLQKEITGYQEVKEETAETTPSSTESSEGSEITHESDSEAGIPTPQPTSTPLTFEGFQDRFNETIEGLNSEYGISEQDMRNAFRANLFRKKIMDAVIGEIECSEEQVWAAHILVDDEKLAKEIKSRLDEGEQWSILASTYSIDSSNKDSGGDLGWFGRGKMVPEFEDAVFGMKIGEISEPVKTEFGWHIIQKIGQENRPLSDEECQNSRIEKFNDWLDTQRENSEIIIQDDWGEHAPNEPSLPIEIKQFINANLTIPATPPGS